MDGQADAVAADREQRMSPLESGAVDEIVVSTRAAGITPQFGGVNPLYEAIKGYLEESGDSV